MPERKTQLTTILDSRHSIRANPAAKLGAELNAGKVMPETGKVPRVMSAEYMRERSAISSVLVAAVTDQIVTAEDSDLGYRFIQEPPAHIRTSKELEKWLQKKAHVGLDGLIEENLEIRRFAQRHQALIQPAKPPNQPLVRSDRIDTIRFQGAVADPHGWLKIAQVAARYQGLEITEEQALPFVLSKLAEMQVSSRRDVALQDIRSSILQAVMAFGSMRSSNSGDTQARYDLLRKFVHEQTGHLLRATRFGNLYKVEADPEIGVLFTERIEGFGTVEPKRDFAFGCAAGYRLGNPDEQETNGNSALFKLLRASINASTNLNLWSDTLRTDLVDLSTATRALKV